MDIPATTQNTDPELLTVPQVAELWKLNPETVYKLVRTGELPAVHFGRKAVRIRRCDALAHINQNVQ